MSDFFTRIWALELTPSLKFTLMAIGRFSVTKGFCYANVKTIAEATGFSDRATRTHIADLEKSGLITRKPRKRPNGSAASNVVWLTLPEHVAPAMTAPARPDRVAEATLVDDELDGEIAENGAAPPPEGDSGPPCTSFRTPPEGAAGYVERQDSSENIREESLSDSDESDLSAGKGESSSSDSKKAKEKAEKEEALRVMEAIWEASSVYARKRATREKTADAVERAIASRKVTGDELIASWRAYVTSKDGAKEDGLYQKGPDRWIRNGLYETWLEELRAEASAKAGITPDRDVGTWEEPTPFGQRIWMIGYTKRGSWPEKQGPEPGDEGCRVDPEIQREFGRTPWEDRQR